MLIAILSWSGAGVVLAGCAASVLGRRARRRGAAAAERVAEVARAMANERRIQAAELEQLASAPGFAHSATVAV